jgi:hypothetical protein
MTMEREQPVVNLTQRFACGFAAVAVSTLVLGSVLAGFDAVSESAGTAAAKPGTDDAPTVVVLARSATSPDVSGR